MFNYTIIKLSFGTVALVWSPGKPPLLIRVVLPEKHISTRALVRESFPDPREANAAEIDATGRLLVKYDRGEEVEFPCPSLERFPAADFHRRVWTETRLIPRGRVSTYGRVARDIGAPRAARAVGNALAANPLPLIVPCHRVVRAKGETGGFAGGEEQAWIKRHLLKREGVRFDRSGRVGGEFILD